MALRAIRHNPQGYTMTELAEAAYQVGATMTGIVDRLEQRGLADRRAQRVFMTDAGDQLLAEVDRQNQARLQRVLRSMSSNERVKSFGASGSALGMLMAVYGGLQFIFAPFWGSLSDRHGRKLILLVGVAGNALAQLLFGLLTQLWMLFAAHSLAGILSSATLPTAMAYVSDSTSIEERSGGMGIVGAAMEFGMVLGPGLGEWSALESPVTGAHWPARRPFPDGFPAKFWHDQFRKHFRSVRRRPAWLWNAAGWHGANCDRNRFCYHARGYWLRDQEFDNYS